MRLGFENIDEFAADGFAFQFGICNISQRSVKFFRSIDAANIEMKVVFVDLKRVLELAKTQQAVIDEDAGLPRTDCLVYQHRRDGRIDTARQTADNIVRGADNITNLLDLFFYKLGRRPVAFAPADVEQEITKNFFAKRRVRHLWVKLDAVNATFFALYRRDNFTGRSGCLKAIRQTGDVVAVAHPDIEFERQFAE